MLTKLAALMAQNLVQMDVEEPELAAKQNVRQTLVPVDVIQILAVLPDVFVIAETPVADVKVVDLLMIPVLLAIEKEMVVVAQVVLKLVIQKLEVCVINAVLLVTDFVLNVILMILVTRLFLVLTSRMHEIKKAAKMAAFFIVKKFYQGMPLTQRSGCCSQRLESLPISCRRLRFSGNSPTVHPNRKKKQTNRNNFFIYKILKILNEQSKIPSQALRTLLHGVTKCFCHIEPKTARFPRLKPRNKKA